MTFACDPWQAVAFRSTGVFPRSTAASPASRPRAVPDDSATRAAFDSTRRISCGSTLARGTGSFKVAVATRYSGGSMAKKRRTIASVTWSYFAPPIPWMKMSLNTSRANIVVIKARGRRRSPLPVGFLQLLHARARVRRRAPASNVTCRWPDDHSTRPANLGDAQMRGDAAAARTDQSQNGTSVHSSCRVRSGTGCVWLRTLLTRRYSATQALWISAAGVRHPQADEPRTSETASHHTSRSTAIPAMLSPHSALHHVTCLGQCPPQIAVFARRLDRQRPEAARSAGVGPAVRSSRARVARNWQTAS